MKTIFNRNIEKFGRDMVLRNQDIIKNRGEYEKNHPLKYK